MESEVIEVARELGKICSARRSTAQGVFSKIIVQALDEVIDGPRTGRYHIDQLEKTEKTYIGTKLEIIVRAELELEKGDKTDVMVAGYPVDIKWSQDLSWMIAPENVNKICLGVGLHDASREFAVGVFRASKSNLRAGGNRDSKTSLTAAARNSQVIWLVERAALPGNFVADLPDKVRRAVFRERSAQDRIRKLATMMPKVFIPRSAFETIAGGKKDAMRRLRQDRHNPKGLEAIVLVSTKYGRRDLEALGFHNPPADHWMAIPLAELKKAQRKS